MTASVRGATKPPHSRPGSGSGSRAPRAGRRAQSAGDVDVTDQAAAVRENKRQLAAYEKKMADAYHAGRSGQPARPDMDDDEAMAHSSGVEEAAQPAASPPTSSSPSSSPGLGRAAQIRGEGAPAILGMVVFCVAINWFRYGWPGVTGWFSAKFENKVTLGAPAASTPPATSGSEPGSTGNKTAPGPPTADNHGPYSGNGIFGRGGK